MPLCMFFFGFNIKDSIALSNSSVLVSAIVRYIQNFQKPHPLKNGTGVLVDYTITLIMLPSIVVGVTLGAIVFKTFPSIILAGLLVVVIALLFVTTTKKWCGIIKNEREKYGPLCGNKKDESMEMKETNINDQNEDEDEDLPKDREIENDKDSSEKAKSPILIRDISIEEIVEADPEPERNEELEQIIKDESTNFQWSKLALNYGMLIIMIILQLFRGPGITPSMIGISRCD